MKRATKPTVLLLLTVLMLLNGGCVGRQNEKKETTSAKSDTQAEMTVSESGESETTAIAEESEAPAATDEGQAADQTVTSVPETSALETSAPETVGPKETTAAPETVKPKETVKPEPKETTAPETKAPETKAPETKAPETKVPETEPVHTHSYTVSVVSAMCAKDGYTLHTCSCGKSYKDNTVKALGHDYKAATCQAPKTCKRCGATSGKTIAHSYVGGDCKTKSKCQYCGLEGSLSEHQYKETVTKKPTYVEKGKKTKICSVCGKKIEEEIPVLDAYALDDATYEKMVAERTLYYINQYRIAEGAPAAKSLPNMTKYAEYRAKQLVHNFAHDMQDERRAATALKYGEYCVYDISDEDKEIVDALKALGFYKIENGTMAFYNPSCGEAIGSMVQDRSNVDDTAQIFASGVHRSKNHWAYVGRPSNIYISIGYSHFAVMDICTSNTDIYG